jgi:metallo-beta-lactamase family protein
VRITFLGGARTVTGSMHVLETARTKVLLECGLFQGRREEAERINRQVPELAQQAGFMILSHSHIDHSGNIPNLVKQGFTHDIYQTPASRDLTELLLRDSARIQEADLKFLNKKLRRAGLPPREPLYTPDEAERSLELLSGLAYEQRLERGDLAFVLREAGHILGSAQIELEGEGRKVVFTGDLGRRNTPIIRDPVQPGEADYLIMESTYGNRVHPRFEDAAVELAALVNRVLRRQGRIVIPAFALGRTQELVYCLHQLIDARAIPELPVFVDSPLAVNITDVFSRHRGCFDAEAQVFLAGHNGDMAFRRLKMIRTQAESRKLNDLKEPCIVISSSGMAESGRVLHHLKRAIGGERNLILLVGFAAEHTLARRLRDGAKLVRIFGEEYPVHAHVAALDAFSAHADQPALVAHVEGFNRQRLKRVFLVHGELDQAQPLQQVLQARGFDVVVPEKGQSFEL